MFGSIESDDQPTTFQIAHELDVAGGIVHLFQGGHCGLDQTLTECGGHRLVALPAEQFHAIAAFQPVQRLANRGMGNTKPFSGFAKVACFRQCNQLPKGAETVHGINRDFG